MGKLTRKQITFDLNIAETEKHHPTHRNLDAYLDIRKFMEENGFVRTQGSVYESVEPIKITDTRNIIYNITSPTGKPMGFRRQRKIYDKRVAVGHKSDDGLFLYFHWYQA